MPRTSAQAHTVAVSANVDCRYCRWNGDAEVRGDEFACPHCGVINDVAPDFLDRSL